ncbi:GntR family transcriptional regulator [Streptococcus cuniculipharyngis]|uniref:GntR family transcriptional regulator n=1 Tax=Streptococcus cuniculipharyngis TaxID=1562651 RepID=A0A5C5SC85_9STRE|nr:GntR family transcriptional regulator [Streptococcus cuniculipharyngis]TWS96900.1 GntR family transcriptional regulator [Streptococcus cuniculipharyngis]
MAWTFDERSPIYAQLAQRVKMKILSGELGSGQQLPTVRELAEEAGVNPNTMQRAYTELEHEGLVFTRRTAGRYVTEDVALLAAIRHEVAGNEIKTFIDNMKHVGFMEEEIVAELSNYMKGEER